MRVIFVHGAFVKDGSWWWAPVAELLAADGLVSESVALPSCGEGPVPPTASGPGLAEDAAALAQLIDAGGDAIVVASSYGGTVAAQAAARPNVRHLVYISSFLPYIGETHADVVGTPADPVPVTPTPAGAVQVADDDPAAFNHRFLHDVTDDTLIQGAHARLTPQSPAAFTTPTTTAAWQHIPSTYLICTQDRNTSPTLQRTHAARCTHTATLPTSHHPFLSHPAQVATHLRQLIPTP